MLEPNGFCMRPQDITLSSQGISFKNDVSVAICDWRAFLRVDETPTHIFLFYDRLMAHIVPKRAFATAEMAARFVATVRANIKTAEQSA